MNAPRRVDRRAPAEAPLLPPELPWLYIFAPAAMALVVVDDLLDMPRAALLRNVASTYIPFLAQGFAFHVVYRHLMPTLVARARGGVARMLLHLAVLVLLSVTVSMVVRPLHDLFCDHPRSPLSFAVVSTVISATCVLPALLVQRLRLRAQAAERHAMAEREVALEAQLQALQARTDPHFLFNSINTVATLIPEDPRLAERTLERLADLFRYALDAGRTRTVPLRREVEMTRDYLAVQSARFGDRLLASLSFDEALGDLPVPPLLLQPLVENAILHGTSRRGRGEVRVDVRREGERLVFEVRDDGPGPGGSNRAGAGAGLAGLTERLQIHYGGRGGFSLTAHPEGGCVARLDVPTGTA
jgi:two-component system, LytTR family, sensor histidine kinase AlgZ